ncbi:hypothetical protein R1flu_001674 [Riccia fluitans]|uniref:Uncharacterized protein n=1 Tax=Riccia fluitans TaxID=41844 RepID=A0ABD1Y7X7_9MARC
MGSSGRLWLASKDEELGLEPQVRCWQSKAPGEPEDLVPVQSICPMRAPWKRSPHVKGSRNRPGSPNGYGKRKMPRIEGQVKVASKRPRPVEKEQLEHPLVPFGAARRVVTELNYENTKSREEKLVEQFPPIYQPSTSDVSRANKSNNSLITDGSGRFEFDRVTPPRYIPVGTVSDTEKESFSPKNNAEAPVVAVMNKNAEKEGVQVPTTTTGSWGPFGGWWRSKSPEVVHQNVLFDEKKRHSNALFEAESGSYPSDNKIQQQTAPTYDNSLGVWEKPTYIGSEDERILLGETEGHSYKVEMPPYTDVIVELLDDLSEKSESAQEHLMVLGGIRVHLRDDSDRKIVSWGYDESEVSETSIELDGLEGFQIHVNEECSWDRLGGSTQEDLKVPSVQVAGTERRVASRGDRLSEETVPEERYEVLEGVSVGSIQQNLELPERFRVQNKDTGRTKVITVDTESQGSLEAEIREQGGLRVTTTDAGRRIVLRTDGVSGERSHAGLASQVRDNAQKSASLIGGVSKGSVQKEHKEPGGLGKRTKAPTSNNMSGQGVQEVEFTNQEGFHSPLRGSKRKGVSWADNSSQELVQRAIQESKDLTSHGRQTERKKVSWAADGSGERAQELQEPEIHVRDVEVKNVPQSDDVSNVTGQRKSIEDSGESHKYLRESEGEITPRNDDKSADSLQESPENETLPLNVRDPEKKTVPRSKVVLEYSSSPEKDVHKSGGFITYTRNSEKTVVPSGDPVILTDNKEKKCTGPDVLQERRKKKKGLRTVAVDVENKLFLTNDEVNETTSVNYEFAVPRMSRAIEPNLGSVKQKELKSTDEEIPKSGVSKYVFDPPKISRLTKSAEEENPSQKLEEERRARSQPKLAKDSRPNSERKLSRERKPVEAAPPKLEKQTRMSSSQGSLPQIKDNPRQKVGETTPRPTSEEEPLPESIFEEQRSMPEEKPRSSSRREQPRPSLGRERRPKPVEEPPMKPVDRELHNFDSSEKGETSTRRKSRKKMERPQQPD